MTNNTDQEPKGFGKSKSQAKDMLNDTGKVKNVLNKANKILSKNPGNLKGFVNDIKALLRLTKAYINGEYREISVTSVVLIVAGLIYLVNPLDVVPDFLLGIGFLDDATVLGFVLLKTKNEIQKYLDWESQKTVEPAQDE